MKILAIRGQNLASLESEFAIELAAAPLVNNGLFAITGPTGAGKSTLLDAMCLALFGRTPRLVRQRESHVVGVANDENAMGPTDPRAILRRGAAMAYAEVDFVGADRLTYRARWDLRRARNRADGKIQQAEQSVQRVHGEPWKMSDRQPEVLAAIVDKLGLDFEQFRRAVLLAQGDFAAFLRAPGKERAALLERVTGSELYARLSVAAFERAKACNQDIEQRNREAGAVEVLSAEQRQLLIENIVHYERQMESAQAELLGVKQALEWYEQAERLTQAQALAIQSVAAANQSADEIAHLREQVKRLQQAQQLQPLLERWQVLQGEAQAALQRLSTATLAHEEAQAKCEQASQSRLATQALHVQAQTTAEAWKPRLARAREISATLTAKCEEEARLRDQISALAGKLQHQRQLEATYQRDIATAQERLGEVTKQELESRALVQLEARSAWLIQELQMLAQLRQQHAIDQRESAGLQEHAAKLEQAVEIHRSKRRTIESNLAQVRSELADEAKRVDPVAVARAREHLDGLRDYVRGLQAGIFAFERALAAQAQAAEKKSRWSIAAATVAALREQEAVVKQAWSQAQQSEAQLAKVAAGLAQARLWTEERSKLVAGEPCPLCGALDHPWQARTETIDQGWQESQSLLAAAREHVQQCANQVQALVLQLAQSEVALQLSQHAFEEAQHAHAKAQDEAGRALAPCREKKEYFGRVIVCERALEGPNDLIAWRQLEAESLALGQSERQRLTECDEQIKRQAASLERERGYLHEAEKLGQEAQKALTAYESVREKAQIVASRQMAAHAVIVEKKQNLQSLLQTWPHVVAGIESGSEEVAQQVRELFLARQAVVAAESVLRATVVKLSEQVLAVQQERVRLAEALHQGNLALDEALRVSASWRGELDDLLQHRPLLEVESELEASVKHTRLADEQAQTQVQQARLEWAQAASRLAQNQLDWSERQALYQTFVEQAQAELTSQQWTREELEAATAELVRLPERTIALRNHEDAVLRAAERMQATTSAIAHHEVQRPPNALADLQQRAEELHKLRDQALAAAVQARTHVSADDVALQKRQIAANEVAARRQAALPWQMLGQAIGHNSGDKFRNFAQGLTFEGLLAHANVHLHDFDRRYSLQRVPSTALEVQVVDHELANEVRSIHSLSGGETFLVSLALALGLSSMSASREPVESLFIDEGFGTLDRETLDRAIAALEALRAGGRQVGIISHVEGLAEHLGVAIEVRPRGHAKSTIHVRARG